MKSLIAAVAFLGGILPAAVFSQALVNGQPTPAPAICPPVTGTIASATDTVSLTCMGAPGYEILVTPNATNPLIGTIQAYDPVSGSPRTLFKATVGTLDTSTAAMTGTTGSAIYRLVSFNGGAIRLPAYTSGSATVTIWASYATSGIFPNNAFHTAEEAALRNGRAFTASTSVQAVPAGSNLSLNLVNPAANSLRMIVTDRIMSCDLATGNTAPQYYGIGNPTANLPTTSATVANRRTGGATSLVTASYGVATTRPDTSPTTANPSGGILPTGGMTFHVPGMRTIEPGTSYAHWIGGKSTGFGTAMNCSITIQWIEETTQ